MEDEFGGLIKNGAIHVLFYAFGCNQQKGKERGLVGDGFVALLVW